MSLSKGFSTVISPEQRAKGEPSALPTLLVVDDEKEITLSLADRFRAFSRGISD
jgi:hypothetical protein